MDRVHISRQSDRVCAYEPFSRHDRVKHSGPPGRTLPVLSVIPRLALTMSIALATGTATGQQTRPATGPSLSSGPAVSTTRPSPPDRQQMREILLAMDLAFRDSLTIEGTERLEAAWNNPPLHKAWRLTAKDGEFAYRRKVTKVLPRSREDRPRLPSWDGTHGEPAGIKAEYLFAGHDRFGTAHLLASSWDEVEEDLRSRVVTIAAAEDRRFELPLRRVLMACGRGFGSRISYVQKAVPLPKAEGGHLLVEAEGTDLIERHGLWVLRIDQESCMVLSAEFQYGGQPTCTITYSGSKRVGRFAIPEQATFESGDRLESDCEFVVKTVSGAADMTLFREVKENVFGPYPGVALIQDYIEGSPVSKEVRDERETIFHEFRPQASGDRDTASSPLSPAGSRPAPRPAAGEEHPGKAPGKR
jgi:hypothetical protein